MVNGTGKKSEDCATELVRMRQGWKNSIFLGEQKNISMDSCLPVDFLLIRSIFVEVTQFVKNEKSRLYSFGKFFKESLVSRFFVRRKTDSEYEQKDIF